MGRSKFRRVAITSRRRFSFGPGGGIRPEGRRRSLWSSTRATVDTLSPAGRALRSPLFLSAFVDRRWFIFWSELRTADLLRHQGGLWSFVDVSIDALLVLFVLGAMVAADHGCGFRSRAHAGGFDQAAHRAASCAHKSVSYRYLLLRRGRRFELDRLSALALSVAVTARAVSTILSCVRPSCWSAVASGIAALAGQGCATVITGVPVAAETLLRFFRALAYSEELERSLNNGGLVLWGVDMEDVSPADGIT